MPLRLGMKANHIALAVANDGDKTPFTDGLFGHIDRHTQPLGTRCDGGDIVAGKIDKAAFHFATESLVEHPYFQVQKIRNKVGSTKYASKKMHFDDYDNHFFIGVDEKQNTDKELMKMRQK